MKILIVCLAIFLIHQSCSSKKERSDEIKSFFSNCDELNIVYYSKDTFIFKTIDTASIHQFTELISGDNDNELPASSLKPEEQLIYKSKGKVFFTAYVFNHYDNKGNLSNYVSYTLKGIKCKHGLTYRTGMGIEEVYEHKTDLVGNPWINVDSTKFHYESFKKTP